MHISTRPATEHDTAFARETHHRAYHDVVVRQFGAWDTELQDRFFEQSWASSAHVVILAEEQRCGFAAIEPKDDYVHVRELVIHPQFQGKGIGTAILQSVCADAAARGIPVRLGTFHENRALALYQRLGFQVLDRTTTHLLLEWTP